MQALEGEDIQNRTIIKVLLYTGMRRGELCGLTWADIDFEKSIIHIQRSSLYLADKGIFEDETKNATSRRSIKVPTDAMRALQLFQEWQDQQIYYWVTNGRRAGVYSLPGMARLFTRIQYRVGSRTSSKKQPAGYFAALAAAYQCNAADCGRHEPANRGCASGTFKRKYNGEDIRSCNTGSGRGGSRHPARPAAPARTVKKRRLKASFYYCRLCRIFVILVERHCSDSRRLVTPLVKGGVAHGQETLSFLLYARQYCSAYSLYMRNDRLFP